MDSGDFFGFAGGKKSRNVITIVEGRGNFKTDTKDRLGGGGEGRSDIAIR